MISVIIPLYKAENYIEKCLLSIIGQTYQDFEIILIDDSSPDQSLAIAKKTLLQYEVAYQILVHEKNKGLSAARNTGIDAAKGDHLYFIDSDDWLTHHRVFETFTEFLKTKHYDFIVADLQYVYEDGTKKPSHLCRKTEVLQELNSTLEIMHCFLDREYISVVACNKLYTKDFLKKNNLRFQEGLKHEDELWTFQVCSVAQSALILPEITYNYFQNNPNSIMNTRSLENHFYSSKIIAEILKITEQQPSLQRIAPEKIAAHIHRLSIFILHDPIVINSWYDWLKIYSLLRKEYKKNPLNTVIPKFKLPPYAAYLLLNEKMKKPSKIRNRFYRRFLERFSVI